MTAPRVVIYCRVSDPGATDDYGMDAQERECRTCADAQGWDVVGVYREWHTGAELFERDELTRVREAMRRREFDVLLVDRLDRISRDGDHRGFIRTECRYAGVALVSTIPHENTGSDPVGRVVQAVHDYKAEEDRKTIVRNMTRGKREKAEQGKPIGQGKPSYGLAWKIADDGKRRTVIGWQEDPATVGHLRRIFADYDAGKSLRQLAADLQADGILPPYHDRTGNRHWSVSSLRLILTERLYVGEAAAYRTACFKVRDETTGKNKRRTRVRPADEQIALPEGTAPVVIDRALFDRVQIRLDGNQARAVDYRATRNPEIGILRRGLAFCGTCGNKLIVTTATRGAPMYRCVGRKYLGCPVAVGITVDQADDAVWDWLTAVLSDEDRVRRHLEALRRDDPTTDDLATNARQRAELEQQQAKFVAVITAMENPEHAGPIAAHLDVIGKQLAANARNRDAILARQAAWQREQAQTDDVLAFCQRVSTDMQRVTSWADRRAIAQTLRVRFELWPATHQPRWIATSEVVPDIMTSASLFSTSRRSGRAAARGCWSARASDRRR